MVHIGVLRLHRGRFITTTLSARSHRLVWHKFSHKNTKAYASNYALTIAQPLVGCDKKAPSMGCALIIPFSPTSRGIHSEKMASLCLYPCHQSFSKAPALSNAATLAFPPSKLSTVSINNRKKRISLKMHVGQGQSGTVVRDDGDQGGDLTGEGAVGVINEVMDSVNLLKNAAKTRKVPPAQVVSAFEVLRKAKLDPSTFLNTLGGIESPGRRWMLIFTAQARSKSGYYFPVTAVQRFDASAMRIENGVYLGPIGCLSFEGRFSWKRKILAFIFEALNIKIGPIGSIKISLVKEQDKDRMPGTRDPFFIWFYVDEEIAVAQGRGGGTALWCRCTKMA